ncbi:unnamed protein product [Plutella xylostella]|uniref:(diamondback moth) hypothetical protein n=1 Tax=Plutella xylostella TaxID=51655 RepID=A0A8S4DVV0_PLUXY|nr:unnamed protein product [Plutella xylostella]
MEALVTNITSTCPLAFAGATGAVFAQAIAAVVAAHCAIVDDTAWPRDAADDVLNNAEATYDMIIVGGGTAGSLLAMRLSKEFPAWSLLLIEAGGDPGPDSEVPAFLFLSQNTEMDWNYKTQASDKHCKGFHNNQCTWSKGKALGGSSSINAMLYIRGHPKDFNLWEEQGNYHWGHKDVLPYFEQIEKDLNLIDVHTHDNNNPWYKILAQAWGEMGYSEILNSNEALLGSKITKLLVSNGSRLNTGRVYLKKASGNIHIMKNTKATRLIIDKETKVVEGVEIKHKNGSVMQIRARREVILSAGSIATPQILMLSGIAPKDHLNAIGIEHVIELPVGKNLQDHAMLVLFLTIDKEHSISVTAELMTLSLIQYALTKTGPFTNIGITDFMTFTNVKNQSDYPDIQYHYTMFPSNDQFMLVPYMQGVGYRNNIIEAVQKLNKDNGLLGIYPTLIHPISRGEVLLANNDAFSRPIVKANYFNDPNDMTTMLNGIRQVEKLLQTPTFKKFGIKLHKMTLEFCNEHEYDSDSYWQCYVEHMATTVYHPVGTAKMGLIEDETSVVNPDLQVHGVKNLRVVDASIMPTITGANTMATTLMIAEKASDIITKHYKVKDEL